MNICFLILAHQDPHLLARLIRQLLQAKCSVAVHYDSKGGEEPISRLRELLGDGFDSMIRVERRVSIGWGEWSMVQATLNGLTAIANAGIRPDYVYLLSGADYPIRPIADLETFLKDNKGQEFIESVDAERFRWVATGIQRERYVYRHPFNWRDSPRLFDLSLRLQRLLGLERNFPKGYHPHIGSQWWVLTWDTCERVLVLTGANELMRFFRNVCVPDEMFFQTVVRRLVAAESISSKHLTLYQFTDYGCPVVFANGHEKYLSRQPFFFARKISRHADRLRDALDGIVAGQGDTRKLARDDVGRVSREYELHCMTYGRGLFGRRIMGLANDSDQSDLERNPYRYFVVIGDSRDDLRFVQSIVNERGRAVCHGELFHPEFIDFVGGADHYAGYGRQDTAIRDHDATSFFVDVLQEAAGFLVGCLAVRSPERGSRQIPPPVSTDTLAKMHASDPNAMLIVLRRDPSRLFAESVRGAMGVDSQDDAVELPGTPHRAELFARFYERYLERYADLASTAKKSGAKMLFLTIEEAQQEADAKERILEEIDRFLTQQPWRADSLSTTEPIVFEDRAQSSLGDELGAVKGPIERRFLMRLAVVDDDRRKVT